MILHLRRLACLCLAPLALALASPPAAAAPPGARPASAEQRSRALFDQARELADADRWTEACPLFQAAHDLNSTGGTALQAANCYEKIGKPERALPLYMFIVSRPDAKKNPERLAIAEERVRVLRDQVGAGPVTEPPEPPEPPPAPSAAPPPEAAPPGPRADAAAEEAPSRVPAYVALGVGGAGIAVGAVAGVLALSQAADVKSRCDGDRCLASDAASKDAAYTKGWVSTIGFGVGAAGVAVGVVLLATGGAPASGKITAGARGVALRF